jgi:hypothetical protein
MKTIGTIFSLALVLNVSACSTFMSSDKKYPPKDENCNFKVQLSDADPNSYEEIGVINGCGGQKSADSYKSTIRSHVCKAGGDLAVIHANDYGVFCQGRIFRSRTK